MPFSKFTLIDEEHALEIIDQMRISVPEQIEKASRLINQRDRLLAQAREEAERIVLVARERGEELTNRDAIVQTAQNRAKNIIEQARQEAEGIRSEADDYVLDVLKELETQLLHNLTVVRNGIAKIAQEREASRARLQAIYEQAAVDVAAAETVVETAAVAAQAEQNAQPKQDAASDEVVVGAEPPHAPAPPSAPPGPSA